MLRRLNGFSCCSDCEQDWFFGKAGECDFENEVCICPKGFSGVDTMTVTQTCHINETFAQVLYWVLFLFPLFAFFITSICFYIFNKASKVERRSLKVERIQRLTYRGFYFQLGLLGCTSLIGAFYALPKSMVSFKDYKGVAPALFNFTFLCHAIAYTMIYLAWYYSLPDPERYGKLFGYPDLMIRKPYFIPYIIYFIVSIGTILGLLCFIILPFLDEEENYGNTPATALLISFPILIFCGFICIIVVALALFKLYRNAQEVAIESPDSRNKTINALPEQLEAIERSIKGFRLFLTATILVCLPLLVFGIISVATGGLYQYLLISSIGISLPLQCLVIALLTIQTTNGGYLLRKN